MALWAPWAGGAEVPFSVMVGDDDGYGFGVPDNGAADWLKPGPLGEHRDERSAAEHSATDGAQYTDVYSAIYPDPSVGGNPSPQGAVIMPFQGKLMHGVLTVDMGDFQSGVFGSISADCNGVALDWAIDDGYRSTVVRTFVLGPAEIAAANADGQFVLNLARNGSTDFVAFDYFRLDGLVAVPESGAGFVLLGLGLVALALVSTGSRTAARTAC